MSATSEEGTSYPSEAPEFNAAGLCGVRVAQSFIFCVM